MGFLPGWGDDPWGDVFAPRRSGTDGYPDGTRRGLRRPRRLSGDDVDGFIRASEARPARERAASMGGFYGLMCRVYPLRMARMRRDMRWLRKHAAKNGIDPEQMRYLL